MKKPDVIGINVSGSVTRRMTPLERDNVNYAKPRLYLKYGTWFHTIPECRGDWLLAASSQAAEWNEQIINRKRYEN